MQASGLIELGSHTHTHSDYRNRPEFLRDDLRQSLAVMSEQFGVTAPTFAFPYGTKSLGFSGPLLSLAAREAGVICSLTTEEELVRTGSDPFDWGRYTAEEWDTAAMLAAKLDGWHNEVRGVWRKLVRPGRGREQASRTVATRKEPGIVRGAMAAAGAQQTVSGR
jgi:peptidoglycan/xylan/chitin deacetylase (PgdA/CDA1 family)